MVVRILEPLLFAKERMNVKFDNRGCGYGKTVTALNDIKDKNTGKWIFCLPTKNAVFEKADTFKQEQHDYDVQVITSGQNIRVGEEINLALQATSNTVIFCTHAGLLLADSQNLTNEWQLIIDEVLDVIKITELNIYEEISNLEEMLNIDVVDDLFASVSLNTKGKDLLSRHKKNSIFERDAVVTLFYDLFCKIKNETVFINKTWAEGNSKKLTAISIVDPKRFENLQSIKVLAHAFDKSMHYLCWQNAGVKFELECLDSHYDSVRINDIQIKYFSNQKASISYFESMHQPLTKVQRWFENNEQTYQTIFTNNNKTCFYPDLPNWIKVNMRPHGMNQYKSYHNAVWMGAVKQSPSVYKLLSDVFGLDAEQVNTAYEYECIYQFVSRASVRENKGDTNIFYVFDKQQADYLAEIYQVIPEKIDIGLAPKAKPGPKKSGLYLLTDKDKYQLKKLRKQNDFIIASKLLSELGRIDLAKKELNKQIFISSLTE